MGEGGQRAGVYRGIGVDGVGGRGRGGGGVGDNCMGLSLPYAARGEEPFLLISGF